MSLKDLYEFCGAENPVHFLLKLGDEAVNNASYYRQFKYPDELLQAIEQKVMYDLVWDGNKFVRRENAGG